ncbi:MAG: class I poly(R)-hydroxyalkanoic acid synthase [Micavibrio aeruginosavorus]|uniref:Class I poly(R)-hydroxyalkanoic acid synthase n=1 Tax=Micavibrio aeruginosavorus TaxID=349221 RepID=A0A2W5N2A7_9BACT|nr:MAG: class I poly(R)-hydroxyalkanoic acid synthase [Micavibrio aeruginosavorus]
MPRKNDDSASISKDSKQAIDPVALSHALTQAMERALPLIQDYMERRGKDAALDALDPMLVMQERFSAFMGVLMSNPRRLVELQLEYWSNWAQIWQNTMQKLNGEKIEDLYKPEPGDRRFRSDDWNENVLFDFIKQSYLMTSGWMHRVVRSTEGLDKDMVNQIDFYTRQFADAMAPTNFVLTNPDVLRETIKSGGENLVLGLENLIEDMERGHGELKISTTDYEAFKLGKNIAATKGAVVYENDLMQLIQYEPTTKDVFKTPVLIVPPWINKYYILDMRPENSYVKWLVDQGHTVFIVSWVNPGKEHAQKNFGSYMHEGVLDSLTQIEKITGEKSTNIIAYCIGGTLLTITLAWMKANGMENRVKSITYLTTLIDFENAGELKLFTDRKQIEAMEKEMRENGVLSADALQKTFAMLRANDMIWSFVINNYLMGREPFPFDLLYWNEDSTNMPCAMHSFYLRNMYLENKLIQPEGLDIEGVKIDMRNIKTPAYFLSTREDHIAPWKATYSGYSAFTGPKKFTLSASGHVAGIVNPPASKKYCYWSSAENTPSPEKWLEHATETKGSWWTDWQNWIVDFVGSKVAARVPKDIIEPAPGRYVAKKAD